MKRKALVIDDDVYCLDICVEYLLDKNISVTSKVEATCQMMEKGLDICPMSEPCYNFILSDNRMPEMTGLEFFIYQHRRGCKIPSHHKALISGNISQKDQKTAREQGYTIFHKPCSLSVLDRWIDSLSFAC